MGQICSRAVIDSSLNLDRLWTFSLLIWISLDLFSSLLIAVIFDDNNNVLTYYSMQIHINVM